MSGPVGDAPRPRPKPGKSAPTRQSPGNRSTGHVLRKRTEQIVRPSTPPTQKIPVWTHTDGIAPETATAVLDLATRAGVALMATGAAAAEVVEAVLQLTTAYGLRSVHVDLTYDALTVSYHRGPNREPLTVMRIVRDRAQDFTRLQRLHDVVDVTVREMLPTDQARASVDAVIRTPHPYRRWVVRTAVGCLGAGAALLAGAGAQIIAISFLTAMAMSWALYHLGKAAVPPFFAQALGASVPVVVAMVVTLAQLATGRLTGAVPSLIVASSIVVLLAGLSVVGAAQDAIEGFYLTAVARSFEVLVMTLGIVVGVIVALALANQLGIVMTISTESTIGAGPAAQLVFAAISAGAFAISSYSATRSAALAAVAGAGGWAVQSVLVGGGGSPAFTAAIAASVIGFVVWLAAHRMRVSALAVTTASIVPLLPGRATYQGIFEIVSGGEGSGLYQGLGTLLGAAGIGMGLAAGVALGTYLGRLAERLLRQVVARHG